MAPAPTPEILGLRPWSAGLVAIPGDAGRLTVVVTPLAGALAAVRERYPHRDVVVLATDPSVAEAALLVQAGADAYLSDPTSLGPALDALRTGQAWLS